MLVAAMVDDLMDRSKLAGAVNGVTFVRDATASAGADVVVIDLARHADAVTAVRAMVPEAQIVAFGSHVDDDAMARARTDGADLVLARSAFFRDPAAAVTRG